MTTAEYMLRIAAFSATVVIVGSLLDWYVLRAWKRVVVERGWSQWWYRVPLILALLMVVIVPLTLWMRQTQHTPSLLNKTFHVVLALWYAPKLPLALFVLARQVFSALERFVLKNPKIFAKPTDNSSVHHTTSDRHSLPPSTLLSSRRAFLHQSISAAGWVASASPMLALGYNALDTSYDFQVYRVDVPIVGLPRQLEGLTITQISDIHAGSFWTDRPIQEMCRIVSSLHSDMLMITGDWVNFRARELPLVLPHIERLCTPSLLQPVAPLGVFGSLGNHDHYAHSIDLDDICSALRGAGVQLLVNQNHTLNLDGSRLQVAGNDNVGLRQNYGDLTKTLSGLQPEYPTILMAHDPTLWDREVRGKITHGISVELMLAGHTHGGQLGVQAFGVELTPATFLYKQYAGLYADTDDSAAEQPSTIHPAKQHLYVNRGVGSTGVPFRLGIPPEITVLTLRRA